MPPSDITDVVPLEELADSDDAGGLGVLEDHHVPADLLELHEALEAHAAGLL